MSNHDAIRQLNHIPVHIQTNDFVAGVLWGGGGGGGGGGVVGGGGGGGGVPEPSRARVRISVCVCVPRALGYHQPPHEHPPIMAVQSERSAKGRGIGSDDRERGGRGEQATKLLRPSERVQGPTLWAPEHEWGPCSPAWPSD